MKTILLLLCLATAGCRTPTRPAPRDATTQAYGEYHQAILHAAGLHFGQSQDEVRALFGNPHETGGGTCGQNTAKPWTCIRWNYAYLGELHRRQLILLFQEDSITHQWLLNTWSWI